MFPEIDSIDSKVIFMSSLSVYKEKKTSSTAVSNLFIDEYMTGANDAEIKVYLYLLRVMESGQTVTIGDLAERFNDTESDIIRALKYWDKLGLMKLDFDCRGDLTGIRFVDPEEVRLSKANATIVPLNLDKRSPSSVKAPTYDAPDTVQPAPAIEASTQTMLPPKHTYNAAMLRELGAREDIKELRFVAESYAGRPLKNADLQSLLYISEDLHFSKDLIDYLLEYCAEQGQATYSHMETVAKNWYLQGIKTVKAATKYAQRSDKLVLAVMEALGRTAQPTTAESDMIYRWSGEYGFSQELILEACARAAINTDTNRFKYTDGILSNWKEDGVTNREQLLSYEQSHAARKAAQVKQTSTAKPKNNNAFTQHIQTQYDFAALEREILSN